MVGTLFFPTTLSLSAKPRVASFVMADSPGRPGYGYGVRQPESLATDVGGQSAY
ncbi:hypothetical protein CES85_3423 (plasmid) [Ochrobactrum quorumnocens]|uniref:Uncharacterized protein n=1 Tax=Ochrobactrum quorumnocens TaxID=271865 RepID=A0A248UNX3_9HYPH|nr:hypothetical protein CES85_3423 [[Ochrobactrum] quorumnocens]